MLDIRGRRLGAFVFETFEPGKEGLKDWQMFFLFELGKKGFKD